MRRPNGQGQRMIPHVPAPYSRLFILGFLAEAKRDTSLRSRARVGWDCQDGVDIRSALTPKHLVLPRNDPSSSHVTLRPNAEACAPPSLLPLVGLFIRTNHKQNHLRPSRLYHRRRGTVVHAHIPGTERQYSKLPSGKRRCALQLELDLSTRRPSFIKHHRQRTRVF